jgi:hypothetical protein
LGGFAVFNLFDLCGFFDDVDALDAVDFFAACDGGSDA